MCPLYPVHLVLMYGALLVGVWMAGLGTVMAAASEVALLKVRLLINDTSVDSLDVKEGHEEMITFYLDDLPIQAAGDILIQVMRMTKLPGIHFRLAKQQQLEQDYVAPVLVILFFFLFSLFSYWKLFTILASYQEVHEKLYSAVKTDILEFWWSKYIHKSSSCFFQNGDH